MTVDITIDLYGPDTAGDLLPTVVDVYRDAFADDDPEELRQGLDWLTDAWPRRITTPGFRLVLATAGNDIVGAVYGHHLRPGTQWWIGADPALPEDLTTEHPGRTLAIIDMMVRRPWRQRGVATRMHDALLDAGEEERCTLLVEPTNQPARTAYASWGYRKVANIQPAAFPDSAPFHALLRARAG